MSAPEHISGLVLRAMQALQEALKSEDNRKRYAERVARERREDREMRGLD